MTRTVALQNLLDAFQVFDKNVVGRLTPFEYCDTEAPWDPVDVRDVADVCEVPACTSIVTDGYSVVRSKR